MWRLNNGLARAITIVEFSIAFLETGLVMTLLFLQRSFNTLFTDLEIPAEFRGFEPVLVQCCILLLNIGFLRFALQVFFRAGCIRTLESVNSRLRAFLMYNMFAYLSAE